MMTTKEIRGEIELLSKEWDALRTKYDHEDGHGGSPGEWIVERLGELEHELGKRGEKP
ncbi:MAG TPA: hypothetical protein VFA98_16250 [Thermoanaerobaculia bacterium]|nr:hypothetical protein [Thermoanaerobaculia bacterium]